MRQLSDYKADVAAQREAEAKRNAEAADEIKRSHESQINEMKASFDKQLAQAKEAHEKQIEALKEMNKKQVESQMNLIREQMQTTSENVLKKRQEELGEANKEQVSKIVNPLHDEIKRMEQLLTDTKEKNIEAYNRLDASIHANMKKYDELNDSAARLTRALTGEVKVQGNFGEMKLRQLLEDLGLKDGEQYSSQAHLRDKLGNLIKDDEGKGLIPDFILHFPNNRDVVVDSKMSFTAYERYVNTEDVAEQTQYLKEHLVSVRAQVERLAKKDYSKYLQEGYNKLNFVIMYIHTEGALNLAMLNDSSLWREAYDKGVLILGPQTMYMNLRILELMWTQVRQLSNQEEMIKAANTIVERTQDFAQRFGDVETKMRQTTEAMSKLRTTTADGGQSIITAARSLLKAGARENKKKKTISESSDIVFIDSDESQMLTD
ncbi:MAG: DNA recombination protein RmuC [Prevotella sp.]|nr:DNA recombination protein RmuC [Prevotella sp.]MBR6605099.1 DNA recombination protein RmuC [Prevotella sp.]